jgi:molybdenum cofactor guanylyltransferase
MESSQRVAGVILAGGRSSRMGGGDKCLRPLAGKPLLAHVIERAGERYANGDPSRFASFGLPVVADSVSGYAGPLAGVHAGLEWVKANRPSIGSIVTVAADTPFFPADLVQRFLAELEDAHGICIARSEEGVHPVFGLWTIAIAGEHEASLKQGARKVSLFVEQHGAKEVLFPPVMVGGRPIDPFFNVNRLEELAEADGRLKAT